MQGYGAAFARVYHHLWGDFARQIAPVLRTFYEATTIGQMDHSLLDVCCGTGVLAGHFLEHGYRVVGLDLSAAMLDYARANTESYTETGQAYWLQADAASFDLVERFGLAVSTFDALNHLPDITALRGCIQCVYRTLLEDGWFLFDLNTRLGLRTLWNSMHVREQEDYLLVERSIYDEDAERGLMRVSGFWRTEGGLFERFEEVVYNTAFPLDEVQKILYDTGFRSAFFTRRQDLTTPVQDAEREGRVFVIAHK